MWHNHVLCYSHHFLQHESELMEGASKECLPSSAFVYPQLNVIVQVLPPFPLPTHSVIVRGGIPNQWEVSSSENSLYSLPGYVDETGMEGYERLPA
jgi:hypothetical protein